ncbi:MAG: glycosyl hydrolase family 18 protein [Oscillospiraceae bacterium]|jgi:spore germination protein
MIIHVVSPGETAYAIALEYGVSLELLRINNGLGAGAPLSVGQALLILFPGKTHLVGLGETLASIAAEHGVSLRDLYQNNLVLGGQPAIWPGQTLIISYQDAPSGPLFVGGYAYPFISPALLRQTLPFLSALMPFTYGISAEGRLLPLNDEALLSAARLHGVQAMMHLSSLTEEDTFSTERAAMVLTQAALQAAFIEEVVETILEKGYRGIDVDFEFLGGENAAPYAAFVAALRRALLPYGYPVVVALAPKTADDQQGLLYEGHDYSALGQAADAVLLMTYEWGYTYGPPMAVAPLPSVRRVVEYALTRIPREKLILGIPNYGYDWPLPFVRGETKAQSISNVRAVELAFANNAAISFDETAQAPHFFYRAPDGTEHEVWFEDVRSMLAKYDLIKEYGLMGAGYWNLMRPFPANWMLLRSQFQIRTSPLTSTQL